VIARPLFEKRRAFYGAAAFLDFTSGCSAGRGSFHTDNLQPLCRTGNAQKRNHDDTDFCAVHAAYAHREEACLFCCTGELTVVAENRLAFVLRDRFPVTPLHTLIIPKRHVADYGATTQAEVTAINRLALEQREWIAQEDAAVTGFNLGVNCGAGARQTIFHAHMHLIPRRRADVAEPRDGMPHMIPGKGVY